jgi:small-conductance mechanosensitive channel
VACSRHPAPGLTAEEERGQRLFERRRTPLKTLTHVLERHTPLGRPLSILVIVVALFVIAWIAGRLAARLAASYVDRSERRRWGAAKDLETGVIMGLRQRETAISLIQTSVRYLAFGIALVLSIVTLSGAQRIQTVVGASFLAIVVAFAAQRFLTDVIAGLLMFFEGWFRIGDTVAIDALQVQGIVESVSPRSITLRSITGEILHVPNSQVVAMRVIPRGYREVEIEFFTSELEAGRALIEQIARVVPVGPTRFLRRPGVTETEELDDDLFRITARCAVAVGREWLAEDLLPSLIKERAAAGLLLIGPIITFVDDQALQSFTRAMGTGQNRGPAGARRRRLRRRQPAPAAPGDDTPWPPIAPA